MRSVNRARIWRCISSITLVKRPSTWKRISSTSSAERASLLPPVGEPPSPLVQYLLAAVDRRDAEHGGPDDRRTEQGSHQSEQLDSRLGTGHEAVARSEA